MNRKVMLLVAIMVVLAKPMWGSQAKMVVANVEAGAKDAKAAEAKDLMRKQVAALWQGFVKEANEDLEAFEKKYAVKASDPNEGLPLVVNLVFRDVEKGSLTEPFVLYDLDISGGEFGKDAKAAATTAVTTVTDDLSGIGRISLFRGVLGDQLFNEGYPSVRAVVVMLKNYPTKIGQTDEEPNTEFNALCSGILSKFKKTEKAMTTYLLQHGWYVLLDEKYRQDTIGTWKEKLLKISSSDQAQHWLAINGEALMIWFFFGATEKEAKGAFNDDLERLATMFEASFATTAKA